MRYYFYSIALLLIACNITNALEYSEIKGKYRVDVDLFFKKNIAIGWRNWGTMPEAEIMNNVKEHIVHLRVELADDRIFEASDTAFANLKQSGPFIKSSFKDGSNALTIIASEMEPSGEEFFSSYRFYRKGDRLILSKIVLGEEQFFPLIKE